MQTHSTSTTFGDDYNDIDIDGDDLLASTFNQQATFRHGLSGYGGHTPSLSMSSTSTEGSTEWRYQSNISYSNCPTPDYMIRKKRRSRSLLQAEFSRMEITKSFDLPNQDHRQDQQQQQHSMSIDSSADRSLRARCVSDDADTRMVFSLGTGFNTTPVSVRHGHYFHNHHQRQKHQQQHPLKDSLVDEPPATLSTRKVSDDTASTSSGGQDADIQNPLTKPIPISRQPSTSSKPEERQKRRLRNFAFSSLEDFQELTKKRRRLATRNRAYVEKDFDQILDQLNMTESM